MDGTISMSKNEQYLLRIIEDYRAGRVSRKEASMLLGLSEKSVQRKARRVRELGMEGVKHGNCQAKPHNKIDETLKEAMLKLATGCYSDFNMTPLF